MEELNVFGDDFLSNGGFHQLFTTFDSQDDICLWDNRNDFDLQSKWNFASDIGIERSNYPEFYSVDTSPDGYMSNNLRQCSETDQRAMTENYLTDMDEWKQNHADDLSYQSNNHNDWELNLENLINENPYDDPEFKVCDLPARTFYCNDSCTIFLKEASERLDTSLRTFQPHSTYEPISASTRTSESTPPTFKNIDRRKNIDVGEEKEFTCNYGDCRKVYAKAGHLKAHIRLIFEYCVVQQYCMNQNESKQKNSFRQLFIIGAT